VSDYHAPLAVLSGWPFVVAFVLAVLIGVLRMRDYLKLLGILVVEALLLVWVLSLARLP
jgi:hypothetical protein